MPRPHIEPFVELNEGYNKFELSGFRGTEYKVLSLDPDTGACTLKVRFNNGFARPPGLCYSDYELFILKGRMTIGDETIGEGHYLFVPAGMSLGATSTSDGCEALLMYNDSEPHFEESDASHDLTLSAGYVSVNAYEGPPWASGSVVTPSVATGCMIKLLRYDPLTEAMTFLYCMTPEYMQDNISYHDCAEESYHIWGTSWMMQFGELPTGGYFWRPPYINHGSFRSKLGCIALGRTDSKLHNYFHFNPWTNPDENLHRAAAFLYRQRPQLFKWVAAGGHNHPHGPMGQVGTQPGSPVDFETPHYADEPQTRMLKEQFFKFLTADRSGHHHHHDDHD